jgi:hypothetical protein
MNDSDLIRRRRAGGGSTFSRTRSTTASTTTTMTTTTGSCSSSSRFGGRSRTTLFGTKQGKTHSVFGLCVCGLDVCIVRVDSVVSLRARVCEKERPTRRKEKKMRPATGSLSTGECIEAKCIPSSSWHLQVYLQIPLVSHDHGGVYCTEALSRRKRVKDMSLFPV